MKHHIPREPLHTIGDLSKATGLTMRALRFYEERGLLRPIRRGRDRLYTGECQRRALRIVELTGYGFSLVESKAMLDKTQREIMPALEARLVELQAEERKLSLVIDRLGEEVRRNSRESRDGENGA